MKKILVLFVLLLTCCSADNKKSPLSWCLCEISKREGYNEFTYCYNEVNTYNYNESLNHKNYRITTYTTNKETIWLCYIEYESSGYSDAIKSEQILKIDCDIAYVTAIK